MNRHKRKLLLLISRTLHNYALFIILIQDKVNDILYPDDMEIKFK